MNKSEREELAKAQRYIAAAQTIIQKLQAPQVQHEKYDEFAAEVAWVRKTIKERGRIWEGCRPAYESGKYKSTEMDRLLREGIIVPAKDPADGYVLPT